MTGKISKARYPNLVSRPEVPIDPASGLGISAAPPKAGRDGTFARMGRNVRWLLGGRGFAAILSLAYLAIAARALGPERFGEFTLVLTFGQMIANLVQFQSWKTIVRYGAGHLDSMRFDRLSRLAGFTATLDWAAALVGAVVVAGGAYAVAPLFHWSIDEQRRAAVFGAILLLSTGATQTGLLRLFDRFDLLTFTEAVAPTVRLLGAIIAWLIGGGITAFLIVWATAGLAQTAAGWIAASLAQALRLSISRSAFASALRENRRLIRFMVHTNLSNSLTLLWLHTGTLAVGAYSGPVAAGGFRLADRLVKGIASTVDTLTRVLYPELARLVATNDRDLVGRILKRSSAFAVGMAGAIVLVAVFFGSNILTFVAGPSFAFAHVYLLLLAVAVAIDLSGFALEPFHIAHGHSGRVLRSRAIGAVVYIVMLAALMPRIGASGAAIAAIVTSIVIVGQLAVSAAEILRRRSPS